MMPMTEEINRLQQEADALEKELFDMRKDCLVRLNQLVESVPNTICILPPRLRRIYNI